jgi:putative hydrolase of the HAD superfamily
MPYKNISTIIFDLGGVLIRLDKRLCLASFAKLGIKDIEIECYKQSGFFLQFERGEISSEIFRDELRKYTEKILSDDEIDSAWCSFLREIPAQKLEMLLVLRRKFRVLMLSNTSPIHIDFCKKERFNYDNHTIDDFFDRRYLSYEMRMSKPDEDIFETLLAEEKTQASACLFLDDSARNIETARKLGFQTYLVKENDTLDFLLNIDPEN